MDGRADIMDEPRRGQFRAARTPADGVASLESAHRATGLRERDRGAQAVRPRANHDGVQRWRRHRAQPYARAEPAAAAGAPRIRGRRSAIAEAATAPRITNTPKAAI